MVSLRMIAPLLAVALLMLACAVASAHEHSWYDPWCCNDKDCAVYSPDDVLLVGPSGYHLATGEVIPYSAAKPSPDGRYHRCVQTWDQSDEGRPKGSTRCFYAPLPTF
jgi:hypothetical protein